ncbi:halocyanin domain-containing protein [Natrialba sp. PRR66]|uniref:halocyanin domain-containing protein n=1 Tax=Natrialba sp. PRR66 TaxID=3098146 RepID=UPI002B1DCE44|nr:halocyanin domain-containing protein [Natrialba sp. PRR66]
MNERQTEIAATDRGTLPGTESSGDLLWRVKRRNVLRAISGTATVGAVAGCLDAIGAGSDGEYSDSFDEDGNPEYGDWFDGVDTYDGTVDFRGEDDVAVAVGANGGIAFDPPAILIEPGTTVRWVWTGNGGQHNVSHVNGVFESTLTGEAGHAFEEAFDESDIYRYVCDPHQRAGMKGAVAVADGEHEESETVSSTTTYQ